MNDVDELKQYAEVHARAQRLPDYPLILDRVDSDEDGQPGSWTAEWVRAGDERRAWGDRLGAVGHYNMARFPFVDGPARGDALSRCVHTFTEWSGKAGIQRLELTGPDGDRFAAWTCGLSARERRPLLVVSGGIVSIKEQWAPALPGLARLGFAAVVTELPGVGENAMRYDEDIWRMFPAILEAVADRADVEQAYALAISFSGHAALRWSLADHRVRGVVTVGAPIAEFFTDADWQARLPRLTVDTLAHLTGQPSGEVLSSLKDWALTPAELSTVDIPVAYCASGRDEIIPATDPALLRQHVRDLRLVTRDDVHGAPRHVAQTRLWGASSLLRMRGGRPVQRAVLGVALALMRARTS